MKKIILLFIIIMSIGSVNIFAHNYGIVKTTDGSRPYPGDKYHDIITNNYARYIGDDKKVVYLTFDNGYENGFTKSIVDTLVKNDVTGLFFVTGHYLRDSGDLVNYMIDNNQLVGNHSYSHKDYTSLTTEEIINDIKKNEDLMYEVTNEHFTPFFRPPAGTFTKESLRDVADLGYLNLFWSLAYKDWERDSIHGVDYTINSVIPRLHNGAIILLHTVSKDNCDALDAIIIKIKELGYEIGNPMDLLIRTY